MQIELLTLAMKDEIKKRGIAKLNFALIITTLKDRKRMTKAKREGRPLKALHVEVAANKANRAKEIFLQFYGSKATSYPLDIWMHYVMAMKPSTNTKTCIQINTLRCKQAWFTTSISHAQSWDILELDRKVGNNKSTLRSLLMSITTRDKTRPLFLGINKEYCGDGHFFTFPMAHETEARNMISQFGSYWAHKHGNEILKYLTPEAASRDKLALWDPVEYCARSEENEQIEKLIQEIDGFDWLQDPNQTKEVQFLTDESNISSPTQRKAPTFAFTQDTASVGTFQTTKLLQVDKEKEKAITNLTTMRLWMN